MPRTDRNQMWEKRPDGSMHLVRDEVVEVPDPDPQEIMRGELRALSGKSNWTRFQLEEAVRKLLEISGFGKIEPPQLPL